MTRTGFELQNSKEPSLVSFWTPQGELHCYVILWCFLAFLCIFTVLNSNTTSNLKCRLFATGKCLSDTLWNSNLANVKMTWEIKQRSVQFSDQSCLTICDPWTAAWQAALSIINSWSLLKFTSIESVMPSNHLILCHPHVFLPSIFPIIRGFSDESALPIRWPKYWGFSFSISPSNEYSGLIPFKIDCLISLLSKALSRIFSSTTVWKHQFFSTQCAKY